MKIQNPHGKFFKSTFGNVAIAKDFLNNYLPQDLIHIIDIDTLEPQKDSYIDEKLMESFSDLLFKVDINNRDGYVYILFEHKSYPSRDIAFQLLKYMVRIWDKKIEELGCLPVIIPLVIYHGKDKWNIGYRLEDIVSGYNKIPEDIKMLIPNYRYLLYDFSKFSDEAIKGEVRNRIAIMLMRDIQGKSIENILEILYEAAELLQQLEDKDTGLEYFETLVRYVFGARMDFQKNSYSRLVKKIETTYPEGSDLIMTLAERFREEGHKRGIEEGLKQGLEQGLERGLERGLEQGKEEALTRAIIGLLTKRFGYVPEDINEGIRKLDAIALEVIVDGIFDYKNIDDVRKYIQF